MKAASAEPPPSPAPVDAQILVFRPSVFGKIIIIGRLVHARCSFRAGLAVGPEYFQRCPAVRARGDFESVVQVAVIAEVFSKRYENGLDIMKTVIAAFQDIETYVDFRIRKTFHASISAREVIRLSALGVTAVHADKAAFLVDEVVGTALTAFLSGFVLGTVRNVSLQGAFHTVLPCVD